jgi:glycogen operon protein
MMLNAYFEPLAFELPCVIEEGHEHWRRCIDTALESPHDISLLPEARPVEQSTYLVQPRSVVLLALWLEPECCYQLRSPK